MGPDFLCIGGQRCGTTWLHHVFDATPDVWTPPVKELHHFDVQASLTPDHYRFGRHLQSRAKHHGRAGLRMMGVAGPVVERLAPAWDRRYFLGRRSDDWYASLFADDVAEGRMRGEITPAYSILPEAEVARVAARFPELKVLIILRDPIARAWSAALREPGVDRADEAALIAHMRSTGCVGRSDWASILGRWRGHFPAEQVGVFDFAELKGAPEGFLSQLGDFLGVTLNAGAGASSPRKVNASTSRKGEVPARVVGSVLDIYGPIIEASAGAAPMQASAWVGRWLGGVQSGILAS